MKKISIAALAVLLLLVMPSGVALADRIVTEDDAPPNELVIFGDNAVVEEGGSVNGDVIIFGGNIKIYGEVSGDVVVLGGNVLLDGEVARDVVVIGGNLTTGENADVDGECVRIGGNLSGSSGLDCLTETELNLPPFVEGVLAQIAPPDSINVPEINVPEIEMPEIDVPNQPTVYVDDSGSGFFGMFAQSIGTSIVMALLAYGAASLMPLQMRRMEDAVRVKPISTSVFGLLTGITGSIAAFLVAGIVTLILAITIVGILLIPFLWIFVVIALFLTVALGWTVMGKLTADFLASRFGFMKRSYAGRAALGTAVLGLGLGFLGAMPGVFGAGLVTWLVVSAGLGAVALTKFGTREYLPMVGDYESEMVPEPNEEKLTAVLQTLPDED